MYITKGKSERGRSTFSYVIWVLHIVKERIFLVGSFHPLILAHTWGKAWKYFIALFKGNSVKLPKITPLIASSKIILKVLKFSSSKLHSKLLYFKYKMVSLIINII